VTENTIDPGIRITTCDISC